MPLPTKILLTFISQWNSLKNIQKAAEQKGKEQSFNDEIEEQEQINNEEDDLSAPKTIMTEAQPISFNMIME